MVILKRNMTCARVVLLAACAALSSAGCARQVVTSTTTRPLPPEPHPAPVTPEHAHVTEMAFAVGSKPNDTDGNSFPDRIEATVMLFAPPHPSPKFVRGSFEIVMYPYGTSSQPDAEAIARWTIEGEALDRAKRIGAVGPQYLFSLSMLEAGTDRYALSLADLICTFTPAPGTAGKPVTSDGVRSIQIGRAAAGR